MNVKYLIGIALAIFFILFGITCDISPTEGFVFDYTLLMNFANLPSAIIVVGGTIAVMIACYPKLALSFARHFKILIRSETFSPKQCVDEILELAKIARKNGLLALEEKANQQADPFFKQAIMLIVDANDPENVRNILENEIEQTSARHQEVVDMYRMGSGAAPAFGMIGTLIGLINMLKNLDDSSMDAIGPNMSVALITTLYGCILAHAVFNPIAANLDARDTEEVLCRQLILEGIMSIQSGENPKFIEDKLLTFLDENTSKGGKKGAKEDAKEADE